MLTQKVPSNAAPGAACIIIKTGHDDCLASFDPALFQLNLVQQGVSRPVDLGFSGSRLLARLAREPGTVVSREELMQFAWEDRIVGQGSLNQLVYTLRQILGDEKSRKIIQTLPRRGYLLNPEHVQRLEMPVLEAPEATALTVESQEDLIPLPALPLTPDAEPDLIAEPDPAPTARRELTPAPPLPPSKESEPVTDNPAAQASTTTPLDRTTAAAPSNKRTWLWAVWLWLGGTILLLGWLLLSPASAPMQTSVQHSVGQLSFSYLGIDAAGQRALMAETQSLTEHMAMLATAPMHVLVQRNGRAISVLCIAQDGAVRVLTLSQNAVREPDQTSDAALRWCLASVEGPCMLPGLHA